MTVHKGVMIILDGLGDRPISSLGGRTPLEAAQTRSMDWLATEGLTGFVSHIAPGIPVGTQTGSGLLLGLPRADIGKISRGVVQAIGAGLVLEPKDIALRCNFATLKPGAGRLEIIDRRAGRISERTKELADVLNGLHIDDNIEIIVKATTQHRVSLVLRGEELSEAVSDTDPGSGEEQTGVLLSRPLEAENPSAVRTASLVNAFVEKSHSILNDHPINREREEKGMLPANGLITRGAGRYRDLKNLIQHLNISTAVVSGEGTLHGLGRLFGFDVIVNPAFTATPETDFSEKVKAVLQALETHDMVVLHIKATDVSAHDKNESQKKSVIEAIDAAIKPLLKTNLVIGVTADHSTDSSTGRHTGDPVPSLIFSRHGRKDDVVAFGESACLHGGLGTISPMAFLCTMLDLMNRTHNFRPDEAGYF